MNETDRFEGTTFTSDCLFVASKVLTVMIFSMADFSQTIFVQMVNKRNHHEILI